MAFLSIVLRIFVVLFSMHLQVASTYQHASPPAAVKYWDTLFPNSTIPQVLVELLPISPNNFTGDHFRTILSEMVTLAGPPSGTPELKYEFPEEESEWFSSMNVDKDLFFLTTKLRSGSRMDASELIMESNSVSFIPRSVEQSIPFSSKYMPEILTRFSLQLNSPESVIVKGVIDLCERAPLPEELKSCCRTFESLLDFATFVLGKNIMLLTPNIESKSEKPNFSVGDGVQLVSDSSVLCHKLDYAYAVFLCHKMEKANVYLVPLFGDNGSNGTSLAVCHQNTSSWTPNHPAFELLKVKRGTVPICHFVKKGTIAWVPA